MNTQDIVIFTDGSSSGNPGPGGWATIVALTDGTVRELGGRVEHTTNNRMELQAAIESFKTIKNEQGNVVINTDSSYLIQGITKWVKGWVKNNWITSTKTEVLNRNLWQELIPLLEEREEKGTVSWKHISGHSGVPGNERCDEIATSFTFQKPLPLFFGPVSDYKVDLFTVVANRIKKEVKDEKKSRSKLKAFSYLSMLDRKIEIHKTWAECEARVKGKRGAKFKKSLSQDDERNIIEEWHKK